MSFFGTSNKFYATITLLIICFFFYFHQIYNEELPESLTVQRLLHASKEPFKSLSKMPLIDISLIKSVQKKSFEKNL